MRRRALTFVAVALSLATLFPAPAHAHTRSWIGTNLDVIYRYRTRGGTGWAVSGTFKIKNKAREARTIVCTLEAVHKERFRAEDLGPGETEEFGFFMSVLRRNANPIIRHCHKGLPAPDEESPGASRRI